MANSSLAVTGGNVNTHQLGAGTGDHEQIMRLSPVTLPTLDEWTLSATARATPIPADAGRVAVVLYNDSASATVFLRLDGTNPTTTSYMLAVPPGGTLDLGEELAPLNVRMIASAASGVLHTTLGSTPT